MQACLLGVGSKSKCVVPGLQTNSWPPGPWDVRRLWLTLVATTPFLDCMECRTDRARGAMPAPSTAGARMLC
eukprot:9205923-Pyramimonas_sp.AAC.1